MTARIIPLPVTKAGRELLRDRIGRAGIHQLDEGAIQPQAGTANSRAVLRLEQMLLR